MATIAAETMTDIYKARWNHAVTVCTAINQLIDDGFLILNKHGTRITRKFEITDEGIHLPIGDHCRVIYFERDKNVDCGYYTPIAEFDKSFDGWVVVDPGHFQPLIARL